MAGINLKSPTGFTTAVLIADTVQATGGSNDAISTLTTVGGVPVNAALEIQSTTGALLLPRMTNTEQAALTTVTDGMMVYNTSIGGIAYHVNGAWSTSSVNNGIESITITLTQAQIQAMYTTPVLIVPAVGAGYSLVVHKATIVTNFNTTAFAGGGVAILQYDSTANGAGTNALAATIPAAEITAGSSQFYTLAGATAGVVTGVANKGLYFSNQTGIFTGGNAASTVSVNVWVSAIVANV